jgi:hypothetical protein
MDCKSAAVDVRCKLPIGDAGTARYRSCFSIEFDLIEVLQSYLVDRAVGDAIEGVPAPRALRWEWLRTLGMTSSTVFAWSRFLVLYV